METTKDTELEVLNTIKSELTDRIGNLENAVAKQDELIRTKPVDEKQLVGEAIAAFIRGEGDDLIRSLPTGALTEEKIKSLLPAANFGVDFETLFAVKPTTDKTTSIGIAPTGTLAYDVSSASDWAPISTTLTLKSAGAYSSYSEFEAKTASIDVATGLAQSFIGYKQSTLKSWFLSGDATNFKGVKQYTATTSFESGKLQTYTAGASGTATVAQVYAKIVTALNAISEDGPKVVMMNGGLIASFMTTADSDNHYYYTLLQNLGVEIVRNDYMEAIGADNYVVSVLVKGRGFAVAKSTNLQLTREPTADTTKVYTGIGLAGGILDNKSIAVVVVASA